MLRFEKSMPWLDGESSGVTRGGLFLAWKADCHRSTMTARCLGMDLCFISPFVGREKWRLILRYIFSVPLTIWVLFSRRPKIVAMLNQPNALLASTWVYCWLFRVPFILDCHSAAFRQDRTRLEANFYKFFTTHALLNINHNREDQIVTEKMGGVSVLIPEIPGEIHLGSKSVTLQTDNNMLVVCSFTSDEPINLLFDVAKICKEVNFYFTGDYRKADPAIISSKTDNVHLLGFVERHDYIAYLLAADAIVTMSTRSHIMQMAAEEALCLGQPLLTNRSAVLQEVFNGAALFVDLDARSIASGTYAILDRRDEYRDAMRERRTTRRDNMRAVLSTLRQGILSKYA